MNWQNIPRDDSTVKRAVVPKRGAFSFFDYASIEPRLAAYFASKLGHDEFAARIRDGYDPYTAVAQLVTGQMEVSKEERTKWKIMFLSLMYGGGMKTIQLQFGGTAKDAKTMIRTFHANFPFVEILQDDVKRVAAKRGYLRGIDGRHLHPEEFGEHKLLNKLIQGSAAGIMKKALLNVHTHAREAAWCTRMVSVVHDEIILDGPLGELPVLNKLVPVFMRRGFEQVHEIVPIDVDHEVALTSWADKIPYEEWSESVGNRNSAATT
jgi:DNA polymerase-1